MQSFGEPMSESYRAAQAAFLQSLAAYSIFSYVFQLKDRHNGNLLIDNHGRTWPIFMPLRLRILTLL